MLQLTRYSIEAGDQVKETGKKIMFTFMCFETNNVKKC